MIYESVFNCDVPNFEMYMNLNQNGLFVLPNESLKENSIITLLEKNHKTGKHTGRYINLLINEVQIKHHNKLLSHLWFLKCSFSDKGFSDFLLSRPEFLLPRDPQCESMPNSLTKELKDVVKRVNRDPTQNNKTIANTKTKLPKRPQHEN